jgi:membrane protein
MAAGVLWSLAALSPVPSLLTAGNEPPLRHLPGLYEPFSALTHLLGAGVFLLVSLIVNTWVSAAGTYLRWLVAPPLRLIQTVDWMISFILITALFAFIFKALPSMRLEWSDVAAGAVLTSLLFTAGKLLLGVYLGRAGFGDIYGPAGSMVILLVWVYYSAQILLFGAEFVRAYAERKKQPVRRTAKRI